MDYPNWQTSVSSLSVRRGSISGSSLTTRGLFSFWKVTGIMAQHGSRRWLFDICLLATLGGLILVGTLGRGFRPHSAAMLVGEKFPEIEAEGWINGSAPDPEAFKGKILVVEAWATRCGPCRELTPEMVKLQKKYRDREVVFVGITDESGPLIPAIGSYLKQSGVEWLNAYGAYKTIAKMGVEYIPFVWVVDASGTIAWTTDSGGGIEDGINLALNQRELASGKK